jgi:hypothetical protein
MKKNLKHGLKKKVAEEFIILKWQVNLAGRRNYLKEVNSEEVTIKFWQEIYDENDILKEIHEKYPADTGHKKL